MKRPLLAALALCLAAPAAFAVDGGLKHPPAAHGHQTGATEGQECPLMFVDPCKAHHQHGHPKCVDSEWICDLKCEGHAPSCSGAGGLKVSRCDGGKWTCEPAVASCDGAAPSCAKSMQARCADGKWTCEWHCDGDPPAGSCGEGKHRACLQGRWDCETNDNSNDCGNTPPMCGLAPASCVNRTWTCEKTPGSHGNDSGRLGGGAPPSFPGDSGRQDPDQDHGHGDDSHGHGDNNQGLGGSPFRSGRND